FSGGLPAVTAERVKVVYADPKGTKISLPGQSSLHVVFRGATGYCPQPAHRTWTGPPALTPNYPQLLAVKAAGDFEGHPSFGRGPSPAARRRRAPPTPPAGRARTGW